MNNTKIITYSLLAHINNSGALLSDLTEVFIPLVKRSLARMCSNKAELKGKNISEIKIVIDYQYKLDIPLGLLRKILQKIERQANTEEKKVFILYQDDSFHIKSFVFEDFERLVKTKEQEVINLEVLFKEFCQLSNMPNYHGNIFNFLESNKLSISKYFSHNFSSPISSKKDQLIEAQFVEYFRQIPKAYDLIKNIYLGSIIASYLEYETTPVKTDVELLLDTNFIISLLDLNTPESTHTCNKLLEVAKTLGFKLTILDITIDECQALIDNRAQNFDGAFLQKKIDPEDIYNACERRNLSKTDLETISYNLKEEIQKLGIYILPNSTSYQNKGKFSNEYERLKRVRHSSKAAIHDAAAIFYVREKRQKRIKEFEKVNCWFVNNSSTPIQYVQIDQPDDVTFQPISIKADELLSILWLSNPNIKKQLKDLDIIDTGISRLISCTISESLPKTSVIRELDENIQKYAKDKISDKDILRVATRIADRSLSNLEELNKIAKQDVSTFVNRLQEEADKQKQSEAARQKEFSKLIDNFSKSQKELDKMKAVYEKKFGELYEKERSASEKEKNLQSKETEYTQELIKLKDELSNEKRERVRLENEKRKPLREKYVSQKVLQWRAKTFAYLFIGVLIFFGALFYLCHLSEWDFKKASETFEAYKGNILFTSAIWLLSTVYNGIFIKRFSDQFGQSNINAFKLNIEKYLPEELRHII